MSLPRLLLIVALGGLLGAVLVWGALALVYGPEVALVLRVLFSAAVAGVVAFGAADPCEHGAEVEPFTVTLPGYVDTIEITFTCSAEAGEPRCATPPLASGMLAGDPYAGAVYPSGGHGKRGPKRPGQWGWRARMLRARRLDRAEQRRELQRITRLAERERGPGLGCSRGWRRYMDRCGLKDRARSLGIYPKRGEPTKALRDRVLRARIRACAPPGPTRADLAALTGGVVEVDNTTATVRITMPAGTSAERCEEVRADIVDRLPVFVCLEVVCATS
jgi:hypothetical protein